MKCTSIVLFAATLGLISANAAPITTTVLNCTHGCSGLSDTYASVTINPFSVSAMAVYSGGGTPDWITASARVSLDDDFTLTLHGGTGIGHWLPCISTTFYDSGTFASSAWATASFGPLVAGSGSNGGGINCTDLGQPLAFDTPTSFHLHLQASASADDSLPRGSGGTASARFSGIYVESGVTYTLVETSSLNGQIDAMPEPSSVALLGMGLVCGVVRKYLRTHPK